MGESGDTGRIGRGAHHAAGRDRFGGSTCYKKSMVSPGNPAAPAIDLTQLQANCGGDQELLREIVAVFLDDSPRLLSEIRQAIQENNSRRLQLAAHTLKGAASNFGAAVAVGAALTLEHQGRTGEMAGARAAYPALEQAIEQLRHELATRHT